MGFKLTVTIRNWSKQQSISEINKIKRRIPPPNWGRNGVEETPPR